MVIILRTVGVMLPGAPSEGEPRGVRDWRIRRALNLTSAVAIVLRARRTAGIAIVDARVFTDFGDFSGTFSEDQTKLTAFSWFTLLDINV